MTKHGMGLTGLLRRLVPSQSKVMWTFPALGVGAASEATEVGLESSCEQLFTTVDQFSQQQHINTAQLLPAGFCVPVPTLTKVHPVWEALWALLLVLPQHKELSCLGVNSQGSCVQHSHSWIPHSWLRRYFNPLANKESSSGRLV